MREVGVVATEKVAVAPDSTVTIDGDLTFSANGDEYICYDVASGGRFEVTGHIILTHKNSGKYLRPNVVNAIAGVIAAKGLVNNQSPSRDSFQLARAKCRFRSTAFARSLTSRSCGTRDPTR